MQIECGLGIFFGYFYANFLFFHAAILIIKCCLGKPSLVRIILKIH